MIFINFKFSLIFINLNHLLKRFTNKTNKICLRFTSTSPSTERTQEEWTLISLIKLFQKQQQTSEHFVPKKKASDMRDVGSTELSPNLCSKEVTSLIIMVLEENPSMETNSMMRISKSSTTMLDYFQWLILVPTRMDPNSSSQQSNAHGWTENIVYSDKLLIRNPGNLWRKLKAMEPLMVNPLKRLRLLSVALFDVALFDVALFDDLSIWLMI